jgi:MoaA/NifB/PqqE/SkfB family radical SAM enzyme
MHVDQFTRIIDQIRGKALAVSLFYYGDPLTNPRVDEMCGIARRAGLSVHITTHFSYDLSDARIERIAKSGLTHLTVAIDGATQESYATTRIGGRLDWVMSNLQRMAAYKQKHRLKHPIIEVQHIKHPHHAVDEEDRVKARSLIPGVNSFTSFVGVRYDKDGTLFNIVDADLSAFAFGKPKTRSILPKCHWPFSTMVVKSNGDVIACCMHREARQHTSLPGKAVIGNVFAQSVGEIWNGHRYRDIRRLAITPALSDSDSDLKASFCYGCARLGERALIPRNKRFPVEVVTSPEKPRSS